MLQKEFETRVCMNVTPEEYYHIEVVYMNSNLDKDEFCALWVKMNKTRVNQAKAEAKAKAEREALQDKAWDILSRHHSTSGIASKKMTKREVAFCRSIGIEIVDSHYPCCCTYMYEVKRELRRFCGVSR